MTAGVTGNEQAVAADPKPGPPRRLFALVLAITALRIPLGAAFAGLILAFPTTPAVLAVGVGLLVLVELTDFLDGMLARRLDIVTEWGAMLDPYADSVSRLVIYWALACGGFVIALLPLVMAVRDVTVAYSRIVLTRYGRSVAALWSGKIKAGFQGVGAIVVLLGPLYWGYTGRWPIRAASWILIAVTVASAVAYVRAAVRAAGGSRVPARPQG